MYVSVYGGLSHDFEFQGELKAFKSPILSADKIWRHTAALV